VGKSPSGGSQPIIYPPKRGEGKDRKTRGDGTIGSVGKSGEMRSENISNQKGTRWGSTRLVGKRGKMPRPARSLGKQEKEKGTLGATVVQIPRRYAGQDGNGVEKPVKAT